MVIDHILRTNCGKLGKTV